MKRLTTILIFIASSVYGAIAQKLTFTYDTAGNQIERLWTSSAPTVVSKQDSTVRNRTDSIFVFQQKLPDSHVGKKHSSLFFVRHKKKSHHK